MYQIKYSETYIYPRITNYTMADGQQAQPPQPNIDMRSPSINISEASREGVINVMFQMDPKILDWIVNTFFDSHIELSGTTENPTIDVIPNASYYLCPVCNTQKSKDASYSKQMYVVCSGTKDSPHVLTPTHPVDWKPILKKTGLYYLLGQINSALNKNIATGNLTTGEVDIKRKWSLQDRMTYIAWYLSYSMLAVVAGQYRNYVAEWVIEQRKLHTIFSVGFCTNFIVNMSQNIVSNSTKAKGMSAASKVMDTHVSSEATTHHHLEYDYPAGATINRNKSVGERLGDIFKLA